MPCCEFCGCNVGRDAFHTINSPAFGVYVCGKTECDEQLAVFIENIRENENMEAVANRPTTPAGVPETKIELESGEII